MAKEMIYKTTSGEPIGEKQYRLLQNITTSVFIVAGNAIYAFIIAAFIIPHNIITGGTTGIGIVLNKLFPQLEVSGFVLFSNVFLLILGYFILGKKFTLTTIASSLMYPVFLWMFQKIPGIDNLTDDSLMAAIFAGCLMGVALGLVMRVGSSTGGTDIIVYIINKYTHISLVILVNLCDVVVLGGQAFFSSSESILLGIIVLVLNSIVLDKVVVLGKSQIQLYVVSEKHEEIRDSLLKELEAGVSMIKMETGYLHTDQKAVLCVIPQRKLYQATSIVQNLDPKAFITITQVKEVQGRGFTLPLR